MFYEQNDFLEKKPVNFDAFRASQLWHQLNVHVGLDKKWHDITCVKLFYNG